MRQTPLLAAALIALSSAGPVSAETRFSTDDAALLQDSLITTADAFILPAYRDYGAATEDLTTALDGYCDGTAPLDPAQAAFADSFLAWQRAAIIQVGPIMAEEGPLRVQLWPDPKGFARRAVRMALQAHDPELLAAGGLKGRSIALINLTALEDLLYGDPAPGSYACDLATAIAGYQADLASDLVAAWSPGAPFRSDYDTAADGNARYGSVDDLIREFLAGVVVHADRLRKFKIERGLGQGPGDTHPERTEAIASGLGLASITAGVRALADLYTVPDGFFDVTPDLGGTTEFVLLGQTAEGIADTLAEEPRRLTEIAEKDGAMAEELRNFGQLMLYHDDYLKTGLPQSIGLTTGFTSSDGD
ncbi:Iron-regulated protein A precursor [Rhodovulum sp. P5]|uniref:imelysin family protein n=1 Tax=Rhodovulum sp. P5 TaxID=1564506 RepID=UPI0009C23523|nr:imelysin family protein [Rhodovulum sp. P5]ARE40729.1 Iron-regulated protein A precursor [Rhodovulum sp. P5]